MTYAHSSSSLSSSADNTSIEISSSIPSSMSSLHRRGTFDNHRFIEQGVLGTGAYGKVILANDTFNDTSVAIKIIKSGNNSSTLCPTTIREIGLLQKLKNKHIIRLLRIFCTDGNRMALVFEYEEYDLKRFWKKFFPKNKNIIGPDFIRNCMRDILTGVKYLHSVGVLHRDLKPQNLLISASNNFTVKIADFGLARTSMIPKLKLTQEVVTLWYRPIELFLGAKEYGFAVDLWGIGTVFYELLTDIPLFRDNTQIGVIMKIFQQLGTPKEQTWPGIQCLKEYNFHFPVCRHKDWRDSRRKMRDSSKSAINLLNQFLIMNPVHRITAEDALLQPYFTSFNNTMDDELQMTKIGEQ